MTLTRLNNVFVIWSANPPKSYKYVLLRWNEYYEINFYKRNQEIVIRFMKVGLEISW